VRQKRLLVHKLHLTSYFSTGSAMVLCNNDSEVSSFTGSLRNGPGAEDHTQEGGRGVSVLLGGRWRTWKGLCTHWHVTVFR
jgi:hypothetical protein